MYYSAPGINPLPYTHTPIQDTHLLLSIRSRRRPPLKTIGFCAVVALLQIGGAFHPASSARRQPEKHEEADRRPHVRSELPQSRVFMGMEDALIRVTARLQEAEQRYLGLCGMAPKANTEGVI